MTQSIGAVQPSDAHLGGLAPGAGGHPGPGLPGSGTAAGSGGDPVAATTLNIARRLSQVAAKTPEKPAVVWTAGRGRHGRVSYGRMTFRELDAAANAYASGLAGAGVTPGTRTLLMVRPGPDFVALTFALFRAGAVPILIDPGMGWRRFLRCAARSRPTVFIGVPAAHLLRFLAPGAFRGVRLAVTLGRRRIAGALTLAALRAHGGAAFTPAATAPTDVAAVLFTSGSTGPAKGVLYTHGIFDAQAELIRRQYGLTPDNVDLPCFPLFALFSVALGMTAVIPELDPTRPARVNPASIVRAVSDHAVTCSFGSPAIWRVVSRHCAATGVRLPTLRRVLMAGAPVSAQLHQEVRDHVLSPDAEVHTPYGATECLPVADYTGSRALTETRAATRRGAGTCVGEPVPGLEVRIMRITDDPVAEWRAGLELGAGEIGEIVVRGPVATPGYDGEPAHTRLAKIADPAGGPWHRMGDLGYRDAAGRLWFCGRKAHRVMTRSGLLCSVPCEAIFNEHPAVYRSALVGVGVEPAARTPVIIIEPEPGRFPRGRAQRRAFAAELLALGAAAPLTRSIGHVLFRRAFPVDVRHNAKIDREQLAAWATARLGGRLPDAGRASR